MHINHNRDQTNDLWFWLVCTSVLEFILRHFPGSEPILGPTDRALILFYPSLQANI